MRYQLSALIALLGISMGMGGAAAAHIATNNFHAVVDGEAYRSAQPTGDDIRLYRRRYGIATILNLRGANAGAKWYDQETDVARKLGIGHIDYRMSANTELSLEQSRALVDIMRKAAKPLLIHCQAGSDRTGLAAAYYIAAITHGSEHEAERQLSIRFGHIAIPVIGTSEMDRSFEAMEAGLLGLTGS